MYPPTANGAAGTSDDSLSEITRTTCPDCGAVVEGLHNRFACGLCGWVNSWRDGTKTLPGPEDDPDWPGHKHKQGA